MVFPSKQILCLVTISLLSWFPASSARPQNTPSSELGTSKSTITATESSFNPTIATTSQQVPTVQALTTRGTSSESLAAVPEVSSTQTPKPSEPKFEPEKDTGFIEENRGVVAFNKGDGKTPNEQPLMPFGTTKGIELGEHEFNDRTCMVGLYEHNFRGDGAKWEGFPLGNNWDDENDPYRQQEKCWNLEEVNPDLIGRLAYSRMTGHCGCKFYSENDCVENSWLYSGHDTSGPLLEHTVNKVRSFRCRRDNHLRDFEFCSIVFTNGGTLDHKNNIVDYGENRFTEAVEQLYFRKDYSTDVPNGYWGYSNPDDTYSVEVAGCRPLGEDTPGWKNDEGKDFHTRRLFVSGCSCIFYENGLCDKELLRMGGYGSENKYSGGGENWWRLTGMRCFLPYGLNYGKRVDEGAERTNWGE
ncbi:hypothetical protein TWF281_006997 [Arthrobotrys megalospora]